MARTKKTRPEIVAADVPIGPRTTLQVGGPARYFASCDTDQQLLQVLQWSRDNALAVFVLGGGSNVVFSDDGFDGIVVQCRSSRVRFSDAGDFAEVEADAGVNWDDLVGACVDARLSGIECLSGIPGLVGAAPIQNIGAYGQQVATTISKVSGIDRSTLQIIDVPASACNFGYRTSRFKTRYDSFIVTAVKLRLARRDTGLVQYPDLRRVLGVGENSAARPTLAETRAAVISVRRGKSMVIDADDPNRRSAGSFFINPVVTNAEYDEIAGKARKGGIVDRVPSFDAGNGRRKVPAAWLIEHAGFERGTSIGRVGLSSRHALAVINRGGASASEIVEFAGHLQREVRSRFGVTLLPEPVFVGFKPEPGTLQLGLPGQEAVAK